MNAGGSGLSGAKGKDELQALGFVSGVFARGRRRSGVVGMGVTAVGADDLLIVFSHLLEKRGESGSASGADDVNFGFQSVHGRSISRLVQMPRRRAPLRPNSGLVKRNLHIASLCQMEKCQ